MSDCVVDGVPKSKSVRRTAGQGMCVLWSTLDRETTKRKILQPFLLSAGDGSNACRRNLRVVWEEVYRHQWTGAAVLQPELCHSGPEYSKKTARRAKTLGDEGGGGTLAREADRSGAVQWSRETREVGAAGVRNDQYVHGVGRAAGHYPLPSEVRPIDGSVYVFRDGTGTMLKYLEWDGQSFLQGKRRA